MSKLIETAQNTRAISGSLLDALLAVQEIDGYLTDAAMEAVSMAYGITLTQVYETASFYSMLRFAPQAKTVIQICQNAPCHVAGADETVAAFEKQLGVCMGETTEDGAWSLKYTACIGQCQASPSVMVGGRVYTEISADKVPGFLKSLGFSEKR